LTNKTNYESLADSIPRDHTYSDSGDANSDRVKQMLSRAVGSMTDGNRAAQSRWISKHLLSGKGTNLWKFCSYHQMIVLLEISSRSKGFYDFCNVLHMPDNGCVLVDISIDDLCQIDIKVDSMVNTMRKLGEVLREGFGGRPGELSELSELRSYEAPHRPTPRIVETKKPFTEGDKWIEEEHGSIPVAEDSLDKSKRLLAVVEELRKAKILKE
jgi:hypothetical protein